MGTPFTAGSIALMLEQNPLLMNNAAPVDAVRDLLISSAQDRGELSNNGPIMLDNEYGAGLLDVNRAVAQAGGGDTALTLFPRYHRYKEVVNNGSQQLIGLMCPIRRVLWRWATGNHLLSTEIDSGGR